MINKIKELLLYEIITTDALGNLLERKGIIAKHELMEEIKQVNTERLKGKP